MSRLKSRLVSMPPERNIGRVCINGHVRDEGNTYTAPNGSIMCRICARAAMQRYHARQRSGADKPLRKRGPRPGTEAARRGGLALKARYGLSHFSAMGRKGGTAIAALREGSRFYVEIGRKGGQTTKERHGREFYARIGQQGGLHTKDHRNAYV